MVGLSNPDFPVSVREYALCFSNYSGIQKGYGCEYFPELCHMTFTSQLSICISATMHRALAQCNHEYSGKRLGSLWLRTCCSKGFLICNEHFYLSSVDVDDFPILKSEVIKVLHDGFPQTNQLHKTWKPFTCKIVCKKRLLFCV